MAELHRLAKTVKGARSLATTKDWRVASNLTQELLSVGQRYASILWMAGITERNPMDLAQMVLPVGCWFWG